MSKPFLSQSLPFSWPNFPGCGGIIKKNPEDFIVEEIPSYLPSGTGEHLYLWIEKRELSTDRASEHLAKVLNLNKHAIGIAGKKDSIAISRQWVSLHTPLEPNKEDLEIEGLKILKISRHENKLRLGHLKGNKFVINIRSADKPIEFDALIEKIGTKGFPNYFGIQRIGDEGRNAISGQRRVKQGFKGPGGLNRIRFETNAYQSALFNFIVSKHILAKGCLDTLWEGDIACLHHSAGFFHVHSDDIETSNERSKLGELSPSAPLFGYKVPLAFGESGKWETEVLVSEQLTPESFRARGKKYSPKGERRPIRQIPKDLKYTWIEDSGEYLLTLDFILSPGTYATSLLREITKIDTIPNPFPELSNNGDLERVEKP